MPKIACPGCTKKVLHTAATCPHCGISLKESPEVKAALAALRQKREKRNARCAIFLGVAVTLMLLGYCSETHKERSASPPAVETRNP